MYNLALYKVNPLQLLFHSSQIMKKSSTDGSELPVIVPDPIVSLYSETWLYATNR